MGRRFFTYLSVFWTRLYSTFLAVHFCNSLRQNYSRTIHFRLDARNYTKHWSNRHTLLLFISIDTRTSTLHLTDMRTLYSILASCILSLTASYCKLHIGKFQLDFWICVYASVIIGWEGEGRGGEGLDLFPRLSQLSAPFVPFSRLLDRQLSCCGLSAHVGQYPGYLYSSV